MSKNQPPKFFGVNSPHISDDKKTQSRRPAKITACRAVVSAKAGFRFRCRDKIESNLQSQMYKNRLLIRGVPRLAGFQITKRRGLVKSIFWNFFGATPSHASKGREGRLVQISCQRPLFGLIGIGEFAVLIIAISAVSQFAGRSPSCNRSVIFSVKFVPEINFVETHCAAPLMVCLSSADLPHLRGRSGPAIEDRLGIAKTVADATMAPLSLDRLQI